MLLLIGHGEVNQDIWQKIEPIGTSDRGVWPMKRMAAFGLGIFLFMQPVSVAAGAPCDQVRQTVDKLLAILKDPRLKQEGMKNERREELKKLIYQRFDFTEMARRALGPEWRCHTPEEQKEFVKLFTDLLERAYLKQIESYNDQKVRYLNEREDSSYA